MAFVQQSNELVVGSGGFGTGDLVFPSATTTGNLIVIVCWSGNTTFAFSATGFSTDVSQTTAPNTFAIGILSKIETIGTTTYTITKSGFAAWRCLGYEFSDVAASSYVEATGDTGTSSIGGTTLYASRPSGITTTVGGPIVAAYSVDRAMTFSGPSGWTGTGFDVTAYAGFDGYSNYTVNSGTVSGEQGAVSGADGWVSAVIVAYKASGGGSSSVPPPFPRFNHAILNH